MFKKELNRRQNIIKYIINHLEDRKIEIIETEAHRK